MWDNWNWQNCTTPEDARRRINSLWSILEENNLDELSMLFQLRACKILEIWAWDWTFLKALKNEGFNDIRWLDQETYRARIANPEVEELIEDGMIQNMRFADIDNHFIDDKYDIVVSKLVFDHDCYRDQREEWFREMMLWEVHRVLKPNGLYFANERHQRREIIEICRNMNLRSNTLVRDFDKWIFIPAKRAD